jgi:predicted extracellular nuclease
MNKFLILLVFIFNTLNFSQTEDTIMVAFWNVENLFDTIDHPEKDDSEFLPDSKKEWTQERLDIKMYNLSRVIRSMNDNKGPDILGVCEVEHQHLLDTLISKFFSDKNYKTAYVESPDNRGIDNGLIYDAGRFTLISVSGDTLKLDDGYPTRLILNVSLLTKNFDTLFVYVNHWPSRRGGEEKSEPNRIKAAETLRKSVDNNFTGNKNAKVIIVGDFNDEPTNISLLMHLHSGPFYCDSTNYFESNETRLLNLSYPAYANGIGSYKFRDKWNMLDQIIVSAQLISSDSFHYVCNSFEVYKPYIMVTRSGAYEGAPFPTYGGSNRYLGGYSDHFPVLAKFVIRK